MYFCYTSKWENPYKLYFLFSVQPLEIREGVPEKAIKAEILGVYVHGIKDAASELRIIHALEEGRYYFFFFSNNTLHSCITIQVLINNNDDDKL